MRLFQLLRILSISAAPGLATAPAGVSSDLDSGYMEAGKQAYQAACLGCHQADGKGVPGAFPPLAGSPWVAGDPDRIAKIVLHGLTGPVTLGGHTYHAAMPPQGPLLGDAQLAQVLTYVRNAWGNASPAVAPESIAALRAEHEGRAEYWSTEELLRDHPLDGSAARPPAPHALTGFRYAVYRFDEPPKSLPDFRKLEPASSGAVPENRPGLSVRGDVEGSFGMVFTGEIEIEKRGEYTFYLESDDGSRLDVAGKRVVDNNGRHPPRTKQGKLILDPGRYPVRLEFFEAGDSSTLALAWESAHYAFTNLGETELNLSGAPPRIVLAPSGRRARIYRNFIEGAGARAVGVGYPGGINLAWDADGLRPALLWRGAFIDAGRHWTGRGKGFQPTANLNPVALPPGPPLAALATADAPWPEASVRESSRLRTGTSVFRGYTLDADGWPTFRYTVGGLTAEERFAPLLDPALPAGQQAADTFVRTLRFGGAAPLLFHRVARGEIEDLGNRTYRVGDTVEIAVASSSGEPVLRRVDGAAEILLRATPGTTIETSITLLK